MPRRKTVNTTGRVVKKKTPRKAATKKNRGRPTKLTKDLCDKLEKLIKDWNPLKDINMTKIPDKDQGYAAFMSYMSLSTKDNIADELDISSSTLFGWSSTEKESQTPELLSDFLESIKRWETKRNAMHMKMRLFFAQSESTWIFLSKNFNQFTDTFKVDTPGDETMSEAVRRVQKSQVPQIAKSIERAKMKARVH